MKVLYSYVIYKGEGAQSHVDGFVHAFKQLGDDLIPNGEILPPFVQDKASWSFLKKLVAKFQWMMTNLRKLVEVLVICWKQKPDVLMYRLHNSFFLAIPISSLIYPVVLEINAVRSMEDQRAGKMINRWFEILAIARAKKCFVVSEVLKQFLVTDYAVSPGKVAVIPNGVDTDLFSPSRAAESEIVDRYRLHGRFVIGFIGSFKPWHGVERLIDIAALVLAKNPDCVFMLLGDGLARSSLEEMAKAKGIAEQVIFTGTVPHAEVPRYLKLMDVVLSPHVNTNQNHAFHWSPLKIFEYMAMEKPIIAAPEGQIKDLISDGVSGRLIDSSDSQAWSNEILRMAQDGDYRRLLGVNARNFVLDRYTWKHNALAVRGLCQAAMSVSA